MSHENSNVDVVIVPIERVEVGSVLVVEHEDDLAAFEVEEKKLSHTPPNPPVWTLTLESETVDGKPLTIEGPSGTPCRQLVKRP